MKAPTGEMGHKREERAVLIYSFVVVIFPFIRLAINEWRKRGESRHIQIMFSIATSSTIFSLGTFLAADVIFPGCMRRVLPLFSDTHKFILPRNVSLTEHIFSSIHALPCSAKINIYSTGVLLIN